MLRPVYCCIVLLTCALLLQSCFIRPVARTADIAYTDSMMLPSPSRQCLDIYTLKHRKDATRQHVLLFFYGGNWTSGHKALYKWLGRRMARKGIIVVIADYPKSPATWDAMEAHAVAALRWTQAHIAAFGGDPQQVFISGHSAGGHLAALAGIGGADRPGGVSGIVLIDAAGLDMYGYLLAGGLADHPAYASVFGREEEGWKRASPLYRVYRGMPAMLILQGGRTYPSIAVSNEKFKAALRRIGEPAAFILQPRRRHIPMITQFFNTRNPRYDDLLKFMNSYDAD